MDSKVQKLTNLQFQLTKFLSIMTALSLYLHGNDFHRFLKKAMFFGRNKIF